MDFESSFYNCSRPYVYSISPALYGEITGTVSRLSKRDSQSEITKDLFWLLTSKEWNIDTIPSGLDSILPANLRIDLRAIDFWN